MTDLFSTLLNRTCSWECSVPEKMVSDKCYICLCNMYDMIKSRVNVISPFAGAWGLLCWECRYSSIDPNHGGYKDSMDACSDDTFDLLTVDPNHRGNYTIECNGTCSVSRCTIINPDASSHNQGYQIMHYVITPEQDNIHG